MPGRAAERRSQGWLTTRPPPRAQLSKDFEEAARALKEMNVPAFHHEFAKKLLQRALEGTKEEQKSAVLLLKTLTDREMGVLASEAVGLAFERLSLMRGDLRLDTPNADEILADLMQRAEAENIVGS